MPGQRLGPRRSAIVSQFFSGIVPFGLNQALPQCPGDSSRLGAVGIEEHHLGSRETPLNDGDQFVGVEVGEAAVEKQHLPVSSFQIDQRVGAAQNLLHRTAAAIQARENLFAECAVRAGDQRAACRGRKNGKSGHGTHFKSLRLERD